MAQASESPRVMALLADAPSPGPWPPSPHKLEREILG